MAAQLPAYLWTLNRTACCQWLAEEYGHYSEYVSPDAVKHIFKKPLPPDGSVYDWVWDVKSTSWKQWMDTVPAQKISPDAEYSQVLLLTGYGSGTHILDTVNA